MPRETKAMLVEKNTRARHDLTRARIELKRWKLAVWFAMGSGGVLGWIVGTW